MLGLAPVNPILFKSRNGGQGKSKPNQIQSIPKRIRKQTIARRNSRFYSNRNRITSFTVIPASKHIRQIEHLDALYKYKNRDEVINFIQENPSLCQLLRDVYHKVQHYFGTEVEVILEVFTDYEAPTHRELVALVQTTLPVSESLDRLDHLYQQWWAKASAMNLLRV